MRGRLPRSALRPFGAIALCAVLALGVAACLPSAIRPTPTPPATPSPSPAPPATPSPTPADPTPTPGPAFKLHTVVRGDTLTSLGKKYGTTARSIAYWNRDTYPSLDPESPDYNPNNLKRGWVLKVIPGEEYVPPPGDGETGEQVTPEPTDDYETDAPSVAPDGSASPSPSG